MSTPRLDMSSPSGTIPCMPNIYEAPARTAVVKLFKRGKTPKEISLQLNMSRQRVYQHIERARQLGELPPPAA